MSPVRILEDADFFEDGSYSFAFEIEVLPEIRLPENLESVHLAVEEPLPDPREFQHAVMTFQRKKAVLHTVEERRLPKEGDVLRVNLLAFSGEHLLPRLSRKDFTMILRAANDNMSEVEAAVRKLLA